MKIIIIGPAYPFRGGIASGNDRLAAAFQNLGHEVEVHTFTVQYPNFLFPGKTQFSESAAPENINIKRSFSSVNPFSWIKLGKQLKKMKPNIVVFRFWLPFMGPAFGTIARILRNNKFSKTITLIDNLIPHEKRKGDKLFTKYFVGSQDGFVAMSQSVIDDLGTFDQKKPRALNPHPIFDHFGNAVSKEEACDYLKLDASKNYLLFFGFIRKYKGLDLVLEALDKEMMDRFQLKLIIAGEFYDDEAPYMNIIKEKGLEDYIVPAHYFIKDEEVKYYFCATDVIVQPYRTATQSGVTQIAYHYEKPMIVTNVGGLPELVEHGKAGLVCDVNKDSIKAGIEEFYEKYNDGQLKEHLQKAREKFSWETMGETIISVKDKI